MLLEKKAKNTEIKYTKILGVTVIEQNYDIFLITGLTPGS